MMAGPCAVEDRPMIEEIAAFLSEMGVKVIRGGAFKPRASPYSFSRSWRSRSEIFEESCGSVWPQDGDRGNWRRDMRAVYEMSDILQIGARNSQNFQYSKVAEKGKPILLKKGFMNTVEELLLSADILPPRNMSIILCERGIRTL